MRRTDELTGVLRRPAGPRQRAAVALVLLVAAALAAVMAGPVAAQSDRPPPREYGESGVRSGVVRIRAGAEWLPVGSSGEGGGGSSCTTSSARIVVEDDFRQPVNRERLYFGSGDSLRFDLEPGGLPASLPTQMRHFSPTGRWYEVICDGNIRVVPEGGPAVTIAGLMQEALNQIDPAEPDLVVVPADLHVTQLPSWLAIEPAYWVDRQARVSAGRVWVVGHADPYEALWNTGDGEEVVCDGPGTVWRAGLDPEANDCAHTYRRSSAGAPGDSFTLAVTVSFAVSAETNAPGTYGPFPDIERSAIQAIQVGEIQAVND